MKQMVQEQLRIHVKNQNKQTTTKNDFSASLASYAKMNSKWLIDLNIKVKTITLLQKYRRGT